MRSRFEAQPASILAGPQACRLERQQVDASRFAEEFDSDGQLGETIYEVQHPMSARKPAKDDAVPPTIRQIGRYIVADPRVCHGKLTFRGTRIFVSDVLEQVERGLPWDTIVEEWEGRVPQRPSPRL